MIDELASQLSVTPANKAVMVIGLEKDNLFLIMWYDLFGLIGFDALRLVQVVSCLLS